MSHLPRISGRECVKALARIGIVQQRQTGSHMILRRDDPYAQVVVPDKRELGPGMLRSIIRNAGLSVEEFKKLLK